VNPVEFLQKICCILMIAAAAGQESPARRAAPRAVVNVTGTVIDVTTRLPVANAVVECGAGPAERLDSGKTRRVVTGADGRFAFEKVAQGTPIRAWRRGYRTADTLANIWHGEAEKDAEPLTIELVALGAVTGRVRDEHGDPVAGLTVQLLKARVEHGKRHVRLHASGLTDDQGAFRLWHIDPGSYYVKVLGRRRASYGIGELPAIRPGVLSYGPAYYPSGARLQEAQSVGLEPGGTLQADFNLRGQRGYSIRGRIQGAARDLGMSVVLLRDGETTGHDVRIEPATGAFEVAGVAPGEYVLMVRTQGQPPGFARVPVLVGEADVTGLLVAVRPAPAVTVTVGEQNPLARYSTVLLIPDEDPLGDLGVYTAYGKDGTGGVLRIEGVLPGRYRVQWQSVAPAASIRSGTADLFQDPLIVTEDGCEPVEIEIAPQAGRLEVEVQGLGPEELAMVVAVRDDFPRAPYVEAGATGRRPAELTAMAPGRYRVFAYRPELPFAFNDPEEVGAALEFSAVVDVTAGGTGRVAVRLMNSAKGGLGR
jgi:protocatechuate 3,4-dioxygenase beta subunit